MKPKRNYSNEIHQNDNPFVMYFYHGSNKEGHFSYELIIVQPEDCLDVLKNLFLPEVHEFQILVDHSFVNDRHPEYGLSVRRMNSGYGGAHFIFR